MIKLVATDLDDTLLNHEWKISQRNIAAIQQAVENGVKVTLATGRMAVSCRRYARDTKKQINIQSDYYIITDKSASYNIIIPPSLSIICSSLRGKV